MIRPNIVTLPSLDRRDATLVAQCQAFDRLEEVITKHCDACGTWSPARVDELHYECDALVAILCRYRARTLVGIAARVQTLLHLSPELFNPSDIDCWDMRMVSALLRDLRTVLKVEDTQGVATVTNRSDV